MDGTERFKVPLEKSRYPDNKNYTGRPSFSIASVGKTSFARIPSAVNPEECGDADGMRESFAHVTASQAWATASTFNFLSGKNDDDCAVEKDGHGKFSLLKKLTRQSGPSDSKHNADPKLDPSKFIVEFHSLYHPDRLQSEVTAILTKLRKKFSSDEKKKKVKVAVPVKRQLHAAHILISFIEDHSNTILHIELIRPRKQIGRDLFVEFYKSLMLEMRHLGPEALVASEQV